LEPLRCCCRAGHLDFRRVNVRFGEVCENMRWDGLVKDYIEVVGCGINSVELRVTLPEV
jgi:hypothetical protein